MATVVFRKARHTVWLGGGRLPYPDCEESVRKALPDFNHFIWTLDNYPRNYPLLSDMIDNGHLDIATEYLKIISLVRYKGIYVDYNVMITGSIRQVIPMASKFGLSFAQHPSSYAGTDYLSTEIMLVNTVLEDKVARFVSYLLDYKSNFEHYYTQGERDPKFYGSNLLSRVYTNQILTRSEAYGMPNNKTLKYRSDSIAHLKRPIVPHTAFYASDFEKDSPFVIGYTKPKIELTANLER